MSKRPTIYLCGCADGPAIDVDTYNLYCEAEETLEDSGYLVVNPAKAGAELYSRNAALRSDMREMLRCTGVVLLGDWKMSRAACLEKSLADDLDMPVAPLEEWLRGCR